MGTTIALIIITLGPYLKRKRPFYPHFKFLTPLSSLFPNPSPPNTSLFFPSPTFLLHFPTHLFFFSVPNLFWDTIFFHKFVVNIIVIYCRRKYNKILIPFIFFWAKIGNGIMIPLLFFLGLWNHNRIVILLCCFPEPWQNHDSLCILMKHTMKSWFRCVFFFYVLLLLGKCNEFLFYCLSQI